MSFRGDAHDNGALGICLIIEESTIASNGKNIHLCLGCAEKRGITEYSDFSFIHRDDGYLETHCYDCDALLAGNDPS